MPGNFIDDRKGVTNRHVAALFIFPIGNPARNAYPGPMRSSWFCGVALLSLISCSGTREPTPQPPIVSLQTVSATAPPPSPPESAQTVEVPAPVVSTAEPIATAAPSATVAGPPKSYPESWIMRARGDNLGLSCTELVYKNGCSQTRTGIVTFRVTIDENGSVEQFSEIDNQVALDKGVVSRCLKKNMPRWKFHPPEGHERTFEVQVALADRC